MADIYMTIKVRVSEFSTREYIDKHFNGDLKFAVENGGVGQILQESLISWDPELLEAVWAKPE